MQMRSYKDFQSLLQEEARTQSFRTVCWESIRQKTSGFLSPLGIPQKQHDSPPDVQVYICLCQTIAYACV